MAKLLILEASPNDDDDDDLISRIIPTLINGGLSNFESIAGRLEIELEHESLEGILNILTKRYFVLFAPSSSDFRVKISQCEME